MARPMPAAVAVAGLATWGSPAGSLVTLWLDASGKLTGPPLQPGQVIDLTITVAILVPAVLALSLLTAWWPRDQACSAWATRTIKRIT
jgi:hypothetical protein